MASCRDVHAFSPPLAVTDAEVIFGPIRFANIIRLNGAGEREVVSMCWAFADKGDANPSRRNLCTRSETINRPPTFTSAFASARGVLVAPTFNECQELPNGKTKQWVIMPNDRKPIAIAVICEKWTNGPEVLDTFIHMATPANALISRITDRMPAILRAEDWSTWLGEREKVGRLR